MPARVVAIVTLCALPWGGIGCGRDPILEKADAAKAESRPGEQGGQAATGQPIGTPGGSGGGQPGGGAPGGGAPGDGAGAAGMPGAGGTGAGGVGVPGAAQPGAASGGEAKLGPDGQPLPGVPDEPAPGIPTDPSPGTPGSPSAPTAGVPETVAAGSPRPGIPKEPAPGIPSEPPPGDPLSTHGPTVTVSGTVRFDGYKGGKVRLTAFDGDHGDHTGAHPRVIGMAEIAAPGPFTLTVAQDVGKVYLEASVDEDGDGRPGPLDPQGHADRFPVTVAASPIDGLEVDLTRREPPPGGRGKDM